MTTPPPRRPEKEDKRAAALRNNLRKRRPMKKIKTEDTDKRKLGVEAATAARPQGRS